VRNNNKDYEPEVVVTGEEPVVTAPGDKMPGFRLAPVGVVEAGESVHEAEPAARVGGRRMDNAVEMETVQSLEDMFNDDYTPAEMNTMSFYAFNVVMLK